MRCENDVSGRRRKGALFRQECPRDQEGCQKRTVANGDEMVLNYCDVTIKGQFTFILIECSVI